MTGIKCVQNPVSVPPVFGGEISARPQLSVRYLCTIRGTPAVKAPSGQIIVNDVSVLQPCFVKMLPKVVPGAELAQGQGVAQPGGVVAPSGDFGRN